MVLEMQFVRNTYAQLLSHEMKKVLRVVRQYPQHRFDQVEGACGNTARELERYDMQARIRTIAERRDGALLVLEDGEGGRLLQLSPQKR